MPQTSLAGKAEAMEKLESIFADIADNLLRREQLSIPLRYRRSAPTDSDTNGDERADAIHQVSFPGRTPEEARRFTVLVRMMELMHEALCNDELISKRNIYYKDPILFKSQTVVDRYIDIIAYTFGVSRTSLNVTAAAKGLVIGDYSVKYSDGTVVAEDSETPRLITEPNDIREVDVSRAAWILVIEKESSFRTLASSNLHQTSQAGKGIILTAKGYPDISTRALLYLMSTCNRPDDPRLPIFILADFDPDGMAVMSTYKHGSWNLSHQSAQLVIPRIQWLGTRSGDLIVNHGNGNADQSLLKLSARDRHKGTKMLENSAVFRENGNEWEWRRELQVMLILNVKGEMEALAERDGGVAGWVEAKLLEPSEGTGNRNDEDTDPDEMLI